MAALVDEKADFIYSYDEILDHFGENTVSDRYKYIYEKMKKYLEERKLEKKVKINDKILQQAIMDYFADIYRLKKFHGIDRVNLNKINSYEIYWLLRRKVMQVIEETEKDNLVFINEGFLTVFIAHECLSPEGSAPRTKEQENALLNYLSHLFYCFKYRNIDKQWLETILYSIDLGKILGE